MKTALTEKIHEFGKSFLAGCRASGADAATQLCSALRPLLAPDFRVGFVGVRDESGNVLLEKVL